MPIYIYVFSQRFLWAIMYSVIFSLNKIELLKEDCEVDTIETSVGLIENYYVR